VDKLIYMDCKFYDPLKATAEEFFIRKVNNLYEKSDVNKPATALKVQPMTGRPLNEDIPESNTVDYGDNQMNLRENQFNIHEFDNNVVLNNFMLGDAGDRDYQARRPSIQITNNNNSNENRLAELHKNPITLNDYESLSSRDAIKFDFRTLGGYMTDEITKRHIFFSLFIKHSIVDSSGIRVLKFIFTTHMLVGFNAFVITDDYIDALAMKQSVICLFIFRYLSPIMQLPV
jgi:hypothetical protein